MAFVLTSARPAMVVHFNIDYLIAKLLCWWRLADYWTRTKRLSGLTHPSGVNAKRSNFDETRRRSRQCERRL